MRNKLFHLILVLLTFTFLLTSFNSTKQKDKLTGAWQGQDTGKQHLLLFMNGYFTHTIYNKNDKQFFQTRGGTYQQNQNNVTFNIEFDTQDKNNVGKTETHDLRITGNQLKADLNGSNGWKRIDEGAAPLAGVWHITARTQEGKLVPIHQSGPRKTLKILTGNHFQWAAINPETKEFFGTGGGTYTFTNGKYTEHIEFFSRDSSRVGSSLQFDGQLKNGDWHHSGLSSRGDKIYEVWSQIK